MRDLPEINFTHGRAEELDLSSHISQDMIARLHIEGALPAGVTLEGTRLKYDGKGEPAEALVRVANTTNSSSRIAVELTSATGGAMLPFTFGHVFVKGQFPNNSQLASGNPRTQFTVRNRWDDGSVRFAVVSGHANFQARTPQKIELFSGNVTTRKHLEHADLRNANPDASITFGSLGTVTLASLLMVPNQTCMCGPEMSEWHFRGVVTGDPSLVAWFHVRLYASGRIWIRAIAEHTILDTAKPANREYVPQVKIGGKVLWDNDGETLRHELYTRWTVAGWIGGDPEITVRHDTQYVMSTKLVPNYGYGPPASARLDKAYPQTLKPYTPPGTLKNGWGSAGYDPGIGLITEWEAFYLSSGGDVRAWRYLIAHGEAWGRFPYHIRDPRTGLPLKLSDHPMLSFDPSQGGTGITYPRGITYWVSGLDRAPKLPDGSRDSFSLGPSHSPTGPYVGYLSTGDFYFFEELLFLANCWLFYYTPNNREEGKGVVAKWLSPRDFAWTWKCVAIALASCPDDYPLQKELVRVMQHNIDVHASRYVPKGTAPYYNPLGWLFDSSEYKPDDGKREIGSWLHDFAAASVAFTFDLDLPVSNDTKQKHRAWRDHILNVTMGRMGGESDGYCYTHGAPYTLIVGSKEEMDDRLTQAPRWFTSWRDVWVAKWGNDPVDCSGNLRGIGGGKDVYTTSATDFWGNLQPSLAYAVDSGLPGAAAAYRRMTSAPNWKLIASVEGFGNNPVWAIKPRKP